MERPAARGVAPRRARPSRHSAGQHDEARRQGQGHAAWLAPTSRAGRTMRRPQALARRHPSTGRRDHLPMVPSRPPGETRPPPMHAGPFPGSSLRNPHTLARSPALLLGVIQAALDKLGGTTAEDQPLVLRAALGAVKGLPDMTPALQARKQGFLFVDGEVVEGPGACSRLHGRQRCSPGIRPSPRIAVGPPRRRCTPGLCPLEAAWKLAAPRGPPCWSSLRPRRGAARRWQRPGSGRW